MPAFIPPDIVFLSSGFLPECRVHWDGSFHEYYAFHLSIGRIDLFYDDTQFDLSGESFWWGYPGPAVRFHNPEDDQSWAHRYITFRGPLVTRWIAQGLLNEKPQTAGAAADPGRFDSLLALAKRTDTWGVRRAVNALEQILLELADQRSQPESGPPWLNPILIELASSCVTPDYNDLAQCHGISLSTLREQFRRFTGTSLHEYFLQSRVERARALLTETDMPIKVIAEEVGYGDVFYFSRQFRRRLGIAPATFRRSRQR